MAQIVGIDSNGHLAATNTTNSSGGGSGGAGGSDASGGNQEEQLAVLEELSTAIGTPTSPVANPNQLQDSYGLSFNWNINSLLRLVNSLVANINGYVQFIYFQLNNGVTIKLRANYLIDFSGIIEEANVSLNIFRNLPPEITYTISGINEGYLIIQNLPIEPLGNLWINIDNPAAIAPGSIFIEPGQSLTRDLGSLNNENIFVLGTTAGMSYTIKIG